MPKSTRTRSRNPGDASDRGPARAARSLARELRREGASVLERAQRLARRSEVSARRVACELLPLALDEDPATTMGVFEDLAADADRTVRATAITAFCRVLRTHFEHAHEALTAWRDSTSPHLHRAVAVAVGRAADPSRLDRASALIRLIRPLLADADPAVRRAVGPMALGALLGAYPEPTFEALVEWSTSSDPLVLGNVAMAFTAAPAAPLAKRALIVLRKLSLDDRRVVWRAVASAMWRLGRRRPDVVRPELDRWAGDETRAKVAREALRHL